MTHLVSTTFAGAIVALMISTIPANAHQPGEIKCNYARSTSAHAVCASKRLSRVDRRMNALFDDARDEVQTRGQYINLHNSQRDWAQRRDRCGAKRLCIWLRTKQRIRELRRFIRNI